MPDLLSSMSHFFQKYLKIGFKLCNALTYLIFPNFHYFSSFLELSFYTYKQLVLVAHGECPKTVCPTFLCLKLVLLELCFSKVIKFKVS